MNPSNERKYTEVLEDLLQAMQRTVTHYPEGIARTGRRVQDLIRGPGVFPVAWGGLGIPEECFSESSDFFLAHNWGNLKALLRAIAKGGEADTTFYKRLESIVRAAELHLGACFASNVLMGIKSGASAGIMSTCPEYLEDCMKYLLEQVDIVRPRRVITLGDTSDRLCRKILSQSRPHLEIIGIMHPSTRARNWGGTFRQWVDVQANKIRLH